MTPNELALEIEKQDFDYWLDLMMDKVPEDIDQREGSVIYDALAPVAMILAQESLTLADTVRESYTQTASNEFLDYRAEERGTARYEATHTQVKATAKDLDGKPVNSIVVGDRFASIGEEPVFYKVEEINDDKTLLLRAEESGTRPNSYLGQVLPVTPNDDLAWAEIVEITIPARDTETDEHLRARLLNSRDWQAYGGNVADYLHMTSQISDVGATQVYPIWNGPGTVKLVILDNDLNPASSKLQHEVKEIIDPEDKETLGYGLAPIDHRVTVVAPTKRIINLKFKVQLFDSRSANEIKDEINKQFNDYFKLLRQTWSQINQKTGRGYSMIIYRSKLLSQIMSVNGVLNATLPTINGNDEDFKLTFDNNTSELPYLGEVKIE